MSRLYVFADAHAGGVPRERRQQYVLVEELPMQGRLVVHRRHDDPARVATLPTEWLEEVKPPSIDDPVDWPLELVNRQGWTVRLRESSRPDLGPFSIDVENPEGGPATGCVLSASGYRAIARAAWKAANAIEGGQ